MHAHRRAEKELGRRLEMRRQRKEAMHGGSERGRMGILRRIPFGSTSIGGARGNAKRGKRVLRVLHLFSGPQRDGDMEHWFKKLGAMRGYEVHVVNIDTCREAVDYAPGNILNDVVFNAILVDAQNGVYHIIHAGPPCNTWSTARSPLPRRPGDPKPMRTRGFFIRR